jgi:hypothetical protein
MVASLARLRRALEQLRIECQGHAGGSGQVIAGSSFAKRTNFLSTLLVTEIIQFPLNKAGSARLSRLHGDRHRDRQAEQNDPNNKK